MKIEAKELKDFFELVSLNDTVSELLLSCTESGMETRAVSQDNTAMVVAVLKRAAFKDYYPVGTIGLQDLNTVKKLFDKFSGVIDVVKSENTVTFKSDSKTVEFETVKEEYITVVPVKDFSALNYTERLTIQSDPFKEAISDANVNKEFTLKISTSPTAITLSNSGKYKFTRKILTNCVGGVNVMFGLPLMNSLTGVKSGELKVSFGNDFPIYLVQDTAQFKVELIVAPRVENS